MTAFKHSAHVAVKGVCLLDIEHTLAVGRIAYQSAALGLRREFFKLAASDADYIVMAAAVADYTPAQYADDKIKKHDGDLSIPLQRTKDILAYLGEHRSDNQIICGFSMETRDMLENSREKLQKKNVDMICANNLKVPGAGFGVDTNVITMITRDNITELPLLTKDETANAILDKAVNLSNR